MLQTLISKVLVSETTFVCVFFPQRSPEKLSTKSSVFFFSLNQQQCLEFKSSGWYFTGEHTAIRIVWTKGLFSDKYSSRFFCVGRRTSETQAWGAAVRRAVWGLEPARHRTLFFTNHWAVANAGQPDPSESTPSKTWAGTVWSNVRLNWSVGNGQTKTLLPGLVDNTEQGAGFKCLFYT